MPTHPLLYAIQAPGTCRDEPHLSLSRFTTTVRAEELGSDVWSQFDSHHKVNRWGTCIAPGPSSRYRLGVEFPLSMRLSRLWPMGMLDIADKANRDMGH